MSGGKGGGGSVTVGYRYYMMLHIGLGRGPIDALLQISADGKNVYSGALSGRSETRINKGRLFGGDKGEGGIDGWLTLLDGEPSQVVDTVKGGSVLDRFGAGIFGKLAAIAGLGEVRAPLFFGSVVPGFRGASTLIYDGQISAMNPYIKPWKIKVRRILKGWHGGVPWYPEKAKIIMADGKINAMNPAHIIYQCLTDPDWGGGIAENRINQSSFIAAANTLHAEGFGLCIRWARQEPVGEFIQRIIDHIDASFYQSRFDGQFHLKLLRNDYDPEQIPVFDEDSGLLSIDEDEVGASSGSINEVIISWVDPLNTGAVRNHRERNLAAIRADGQIISVTQDYSGLPTKELAARVAVRELATRSSGLKRFKMKLDRRGWQLEPGSVFRIRSLRRGINNMVVRAGRIEDGTLDKAELTINAMQDVFGMPSNSMSEVQSPLWIQPERDVKPVTLLQPFELSWRDLAASWGLAELETVPEMVSFLAVAAAAPSAANTGYQLQTRIGGQQWQSPAAASFTPYVVLKEQIQAHTTNLVIEIVAAESLLGTDANEALLINNELMRLDDVDYDEQEGKVIMTVGRGCVDTLPQEHPAGSIIWMIDSSIAVDQTEHSNNISLELRLLSATSSEQLEPERAPIVNFQLSDRSRRPYPPGQIKINGDYAPQSAEGSITVSWANRDRILQAERLIDHTMDSIGPEPGTTCAIRLLDATSNSVLLAQTGITDTTVVLETEFEGEVIIELWCERDGLESWQKYRRKLFYSNLLEP